MFTQHLRRNPPHQKLGHGSYAIMLGDYKLVYYQGWPQQQGQGAQIEMYNLRDDPEELVDLSSVDRERTKDMLAVLMDELDKADAPYKD